MRSVTAVAPDLAADEIVRLDAGGAFVDRGDAHVAIVLGDTGLLDVTHAAVHLDAERRDFLADLRRKRFRDRCHEVAACSPYRCRDFIVAVIRAIEA